MTCKLTAEEVCERITAILKAAGVEAYITDAYISATFPDGERALYKRLDIDTRK